MTSAQVSNLTEYLARKHKVTSPEAVDLCRESIELCSCGSNGDRVWGSLTAGDVVRAMKLRQFVTSRQVAA